MVFYINLMTTLLVYKAAMSASSLFGSSKRNRNETELYLKPGAIIKERQICQTFQLNSAHDEFILHKEKKRAYDNRQEPCWFRQTRAK